MPIWTYGIQLRVAVKKIQHIKNTNLPIHNPPHNHKCPLLCLSVSNHTFHKDLKMNTIEKTAKILYKRFCSRLTNHSNPLISALGSDIIPDNPARRSKGKWCRDLNFN